MTVQTQKGFRGYHDREIAKLGFGHNSVLVAALGLYLGVDDLEELAAESLTDGSNDKKIDACHIDLSEKRVIIAQGYQSKTWGKPAAKTNKASDLNTALSWLLSADMAAVPEQLQPKAEELRRAAEEGDLERLELLFVHNCHESENAASEMKAAALTCKQLLAKYPSANVDITYREMGIESLDAVYDAIDKPIIVEDSIPVPHSGCLEKKTDNWSSIVATIPGLFLKELHEKYGDRLFSGNVRDFLGVTKHKGNINSGIQKTASAEGENFWVFNNGITALTNAWHLKDGKLSLDGISIINGAQTSGALAGCSKDDLQDVEVVCRIVTCGEQALVDKIVKFNNTQNVIRPSDLRSSHPVQRRLETEFKNAGIQYVIRRSASRTSKYGISAEGVAPALLAFHGHPQTASKAKREIFESDSTFSEVFPESVKAEHVFLVHSFAAALDSVKLAIKFAVSDDSATAKQLQQHNTLKWSGSKWFVLYVVGMAAEEIMGTKVPSVPGWCVRKSDFDPKSTVLRECCESVIKTLLPLIANATKAEGESAYDVTRSVPKMRKVASSVQSLLGAFEDTLGEQVLCIRAKTKV